jgi:hypothetical protein
VAEEVLESVGEARARDEVHARIEGYFHRQEMRERVRRYLVGLLCRVERLDCAAARGRSIRCNNVWTW